MINLIVKTRDGFAHAVAGKPSITLMEAIRKSDIDELVALCGGSCSCATCHVFVETGPDELQSPASEDEDDLLDSSDYRAPNSRLSCQIELGDDLDGLVVRIAPET
jgi:ferredoxin